MRKYINRLGVGGRLLLAFLGISGFAAVVAATGVITFLAIGGVIDRITKERVPSALAALEVSRQAGRVVSAAPVLLTVEDGKQLAIRAREIDAEIDRLDKLIRVLGTAEFSPSELTLIRDSSRELRLNLASLNEQMRERLILASGRKEAIERAQSVYDQIRELLEPWILVTDARISKWRDVTNREDTPAEERAEADDDLKESLSWLRSLHELQLLMTSVSERLQRLAASDDRQMLQMSRFRLALLMRKADGLVAVLDPKLQPQMSDLLKQYQGLVSGPESILKLRQAELEIVAEAEGTLQQNATLSQRLTGAVNDLVERARHDITAANAEADAVQRTSMSVTIAVVVLSLFCSVLIVWLYVGRNLVARLTALSDSMLAIAGGDLRAPLPAARGGDEISRMAEALTVFRDTAVEVEEKNLREIEETRRRLVDALESTAEGFAFYDNEDRLELCNTKYEEMLYPGLGRRIGPGTRFEDIIREAAEGGLVPDAEADIDAWVAERLERHHNPGEPHLHQLRDGLWVLISERKTSTGGTVAVYADITELKQREEELAEKSDALEEKSKALEQLSNQLAKYLSPQVYDSIFSGRQEVKVASSRKKLTIFFSDIAGFTETADRLESEELTKLLNHYLTEMSRIALDHGATIDKFVGDAILIFFGDPETRGVKEDALACVNMAIAMRNRLNELQKVWRASGIEKPLRCRMGIHTDYCTVGNFGSETRMDYTIIGGGVNLASRLEAAGTPGSILISYETFAHVSDQIFCREHGKLDVKGIAHPVATYEVIDLFENLSGHYQFIDSEILQEICEKISMEIHAIVSIFEQRGEIIASSMPERIGDFHEGGAKVMTGELDSYEVTAAEAATSQGMMEGITLPIEFAGERVLCVGVAAPLDVARHYGRIVQHWVLSHLKEAKKRAGNSSD
jgi:class 3 adenylate cyclase/methyl-accepting chemotaxis protein